MKLMLARRTVFSIPFIFLLFAIQSNAQKKRVMVVLKKDFSIQKHTVMERFEPDYVSSVQKRTELKNERIAVAEYTLTVLDTIRISARKRRLLLRDLKYKPLSDRLTTFVVETQFEADANAELPE